MNVCINEKRNKNIEGKKFILCIVQRKNIENGEYLGKKIFCYANQVPRRDIFRKKREVENLMTMPL